MSAAHEVLHELQAASEPASRRGLLTPQEVADVLRCGLASVYNLMKRGELRYVKFLRTRRVEASALDEFIDRHRTAPPIPETKRWGRRG